MDDTRNNISTIQIKNISLAKDLLTLLILHMTLSSLVAIVFCTSDYYGFLNEDLTSYWFLFLPLPFYFYAVRRLVGNVAIFAILHLLPVITIVIIKNNVISNGVINFLLVCTIGYMIHSISLKLSRPGSVEVPPVSLVYSCVCALICITLCTIQGMRSYYIYFYISAISSIGLFYVNNYLETYIRFIKLNENMASTIPQRSIFRSGLASSSVFAVTGVLIAAFIVSIDKFEALLIMIKNGLFDFLKWLLSFIPEGDPVLEEGAVETPVMERPELLDELIKEQESSRFLDILEEIFKYIMIIIFVAALAFFIYCLITKLIKMIKAAFIPKDLVLIQDDSEGDIREKCSIERLNRTKKPRFHLFMSNELKIRKMFEKQVLLKHICISASDHFSLKYKSAGDYLTDFSDPDAIRLYDKARYSNSKCTQDDVKCMKEYSN